MLTQPCISASTYILAFYFECCLLRNAYLEPHTNPDTRNCLKKKIFPLSCFKNHTTKAKNWKAVHKFIESNVMLGLSPSEGGQLD